MERQQSIVVADKAGVRGLLGDKVASSYGGSHIVVRLGDGREVLVPNDLLISQADGSYYIPVELEELYRQHQQREAASIAQDDGRIVLPVIEETVSVEKRAVETGAVRVRKLVREREELVEDTLLREEVDVERVPINRVVDGPVEVRREGNTTIIPILEEVLVVEKRLMLKEEVRLTMRQTTTDFSERVTLRSEDVDVERTQSPDPQAR